MAAPRDYAIVSFWIPKSLRERLHKLYPRYGELSKALRFLAQKLADGRLTTKN